MASNAMHRRERQNGEGGSSGHGTPLLFTGEDQREPGEAPKALVSLSYQLLTGHATIGSFPGGRVGVDGLGRLLVVRPGETQSRE